LSNFVFFLILLSAFSHVSWNILIKRSQDKILFTRSLTLVGSIILIPITFFLDPLPVAAYPFFAATLIIHVFYKLFLCYMHEKSDLSYAYPIARGLPSLLILFITPFVFDEELTLKNEIAVLTICLGILLLVFANQKFKNINFIGLGYAILVALTITAYTINDAIGVRISEPIMYITYYFALDGIVFNLAFIIFFRKHKFNLDLIKKEIKPIIIAGILSLYSYYPAVYAFSITKVASVAALRECSILLASLYGVFFLKEKFGIVRILSAILIFLGCIMIKLYS
jgi:drug/metabolite transporter (DMT)-like permease